MKATFSGSLERPLYTYLTVFHRQILPANMCQLIYILFWIQVAYQPESLSCNESGRFGAFKSDSTHHFFRNACTKSGSLRFSQFSGCWLILSVYIRMSFDFPFGRLFGVRYFVITLNHCISEYYLQCWKMMRCHFVATLKVVHCFVVLWNLSYYFVKTI